MIRLQGKDRLTFPVTPAEIQFKGYGNDTENTTSITLYTGNRISGRRPKSISFEFMLPGDVDAEYIEVQGYQGPRAWLSGIDRLLGTEVLLTIDELNLAWNVLIGPCDGSFRGKNVDFHGTIELPLFVKDEFVTWSNQKQVLSPASVVAKPKAARANTSGKKAKKTSSTSLVDPAIQAIQRDRIDRKLASQDRAIGT
ncbi:hypothetical protein P9578_03715 [Brevibacillus choshinensis]|uniref:hypothetical protein n=1 Tax=Brevibacillus choshinensis TaxID=54911 RepID=UPI002E1FEFB0|nr:hypothetical protein [Brevibacillus choshinensis]